MFIGSTTNSSPTRLFDVADTLSGAFTAVTLTKDGLITANENSVPVGILTGDCDGDTATVQVTGGALWKAGGTSIVAGDFLSANENGLAVKATSGQFAFGIALTNASSSAVVETQIINGGFVR